MKGWREEGGLIEELLSGIMICGFFGSGFFLEDPEEI